MILPTSLSTWTLSSWSINCLAIWESFDNKLLFSGKSALPYLGFASLLSAGLMTKVICTVLMMIKAPKGYLNDMKLLVSWFKHHRDVFLFCFYRKRCINGSVTDSRVTILCLFHKLGHPFHMCDYNTIVLGRRLDYLFLKLICHHYVF